VLHVALRDPRTSGVVVDGHDVNAEVHEVLGRMADFADRVRSRAEAKSSDDPLTWADITVRRLRHDAQRHRLVGGRTAGSL
jgi:hypothetical protein